MTDQVDTVFDPQLFNLAFQSRAFRALADDPANEVKTLIAKRGAGFDEKVMGLYLMQASDGEETEPAVVLRACGGGCGPGKNAIDPKPLHDDFFRGCGRVVAENVLAVEIGDGYTELASTQLGREQVRALQQIGAVQGEAEADSEQTGSGQGHP